MDFEYASDHHDEERDFDDDCDDERDEEDDDHVNECGNTSLFSHVQNAGQKRKNNNDNTPGKRGMSFLDFDDNSSSSSSSSRQLVQPQREQSLVVRADDGTNIEVPSSFARSFATRIADVASVNVAVSVGKPADMLRMKLGAFLDMFNAWVDAKIKHNIFPFHINGEHTFDAIPQLTLVRQGGGYNPRCLIPDIYLPFLNRAVMNSFRAGQKYNYSETARNKHTAAFGTHGFTINNDAAHITDNQFFPSIEKHHTFNSPIVIDFDWLLSSGPTAVREITGRIFNDAVVEYIVSQIDRAIHFNFALISVDVTGSESILYYTDSEVAKNMLAPYAAAIGAPDLHRRIPHEAHILVQRRPCSLEQIRTSGKDGLHVIVTIPAVSEARELFRATLAQLLDYNEIMRLAGYDAGDFTRAETDRKVVGAELYSHEIMNEILDSAISGGSAPWPLFGADKVGSTKSPYEFVGSWRYDATKFKPTQHVDNIEVDVRNGGLRTVRHLDTPICLSLENLRNPDWLAEFGFVLMSRYPLHTVFPFKCGSKIRKAIQDNQHRLHSYNHIETSRRVNADAQGICTDFIDTTYTFDDFAPIKERFDEWFETFKGGSSNKLIVAAMTVIRNLPAGYFTKGDPLHQYKTRCRICWALKSISPVLIVAWLYMLRDRTDNFHDKLREWLKVWSDGDNRGDGMKLIKELADRNNIVITTILINSSVITPTYALKALRELSNQIDSYIARIYGPATTRIFTDAFYGVVKEKPLIEDYLNSPMFADFLVREFHTKLFHVVNMDSTNQPLDKDTPIVVWNGKIWEQRPGYIDNELIANDYQKLFDMGLKHCDDLIRKFVNKLATEHLPAIIEDQRDEATSIAVDAAGTAATARLSPLDALTMVKSALEDPATFTSTEADIKTNVVTFKTVIECIDACIISNRYSSELRDNFLTLKEMFKVRRTIVRFAVKSNSAPSGLINTIKSKCLDRKQTFHEKFNTEKYVFPCANGVLKFTKSEDPTRKYDVTLGERTPDYLFTNCGGARYTPWEDLCKSDPSGVADLCEYMSSLFPCAYDLMAVCTYFGASLVGDYTITQRMMTLYGKGGDGKSTFLHELVKPVLGSFTNPAIECGVIAYNEQDPGRPSPYALDLRGYRTAFTKEPEYGIVLCGNNVKTTNNGIDPIVGRGVFGRTMVKFVNQAYICMATNHKPSLDSLDKGSRRRLGLFIMKGIRYRDDKEIADAIDRNPEMVHKYKRKLDPIEVSRKIAKIVPHFFSLIVECFCRFGYIIPNEKEAELHQSDMYPVKNFISTHIKLAPAGSGHSISIDDMSEKFKNYIGKYNFSSNALATQFTNTVKDWVGIIFQNNKDVVAVSNSIRGLMFMDEVEVVTATKKLDDAMAKLNDDMENTYYAPEYNTDFFHNLDNFRPCIAAVSGV